MAVNPLVGSWRLVSFHNESSEGSVTYPWGKEVAGYITYTDWGRMAVVFQKGDRPRSSSGDLWRRTPQEKAEAYDTCIAYSGTYDVQGNQVIHHVEVCTFEDWVGTDLVRAVKLEGNRVTLTTPPTPFGSGTAVAVLVWERA